MSNLLTAQQVQEQFNVSRSTLLRYEREGRLTNALVRTPGNQRRYRAETIGQALTQSSNQMRPQFAEFGDTGLNRWGGHIVESDVTELTGTRAFTTYRDMRRNDPVIAAIFFAIENSLKQASVRIKPASDKPADKEAAEFIERSLHDMSFAWTDTLDFICDFLVVGTSLLELSYKRCLGTQPPAYINDPATSKYNDGRISWRKWAPRPLDTLTYGNEWIFGAGGSILGINQTVPTTGESVIIPIDKLLMFRTSAAPYNSPLATPIHRAAYTAYYYSKNFQEIEGIGVERDLAGIPVVYLGNDTIKSGANSDFELAKDLVVNLRNDEQAGIVVPYPKMGKGAAEGSGMLIELLSTAGARAHDVGAILERLDKRKALTVLAQFIMLGMDRYGSYALSKTQNDLFSLAISAWLAKIADVINMYAIPRLLRYNVFPRTTGQPLAVFRDTGVSDIASVASFVNQMVGSEVISPDAELERHLRQLAHLPEPAPADIKTKQAVKPKPVLETALVIRRILLALKELPAYQGLSDEQLQTLIAPLLEQMRLGVQRDTGQEIVYHTVENDPATNTNPDQQLAATVQEIINQSTR